MSECLFEIGEIVKGTDGNEYKILETNRPGDYHPMIVLDINSGGLRCCTNDGVFSFGHKLITNLETTTVTLYCNVYDDGGIEGYSDKDAAIAIARVNEGCASGVAIPTEVTVKWRRPKTGEGK